MGQADFPTKNGRFLPASENECVSRNEDESPRRQVSLMYASLLLTSCQDKHYRRPHASLHQLESPGQ